MIHAFLKNISKNQLCSKDDKILLAVSGGMDSVCLSYLCKEAELSFGIAHCNFKLRGTESDQDEVFVKSLAEQLGVSFYSQAFDTASYAKDHKASIQMAARNLRYEWLEKIRQEGQFTFIATAHHLNDSIETVLYNFSKGCGIRGLHGILSKNQNIIRPILFASRAEIAEYVKAHGIDYREDASNASDKYSRNFIRHQIIPKLKELNPSFEKSTAETIEKIKETEFLFQQIVNQYKEDVVEENIDHSIIHYKKLPDEAASTLLFEILNPFGFNSAQIKMMLETDHQSGISFYSDSHILLLDREHFLLKKNEPPKQVTLNVKENEEAIFIKDKMIVFEKLTSIPSPIPTSPLQAILDFEKLTFPLQIRPWKAGDIFQPIGMNGKHQKIQDFLTHKKLSRFEKEEVHVLESAGQICWVLGMRIDERFKVVDTTKTCFHVQIKNK